MLMTVEPCATQAILAATWIFVNNPTLLVDVQDSMSKGATTSYSQDTHISVDYPKRT